MGAQGCRGLIVSIVDHASKLTRLAKVPSKHADVVTADNGKEFAEHLRIAKILKASYYFAHPFSPQERGLNEQINGLVRQYFPKGTSFESLTQKEMAFVMERLNNRPRKSLGFKTPNEIINFNKKIALII